MILQTSPQSPHSPQSQTKEDQEVKYPFQVVCSVCHKVISYSGKNGDIYSVKCDQCEGI